MRVGDHKDQCGRALDLRLTGVLLRQEPPGCVASMIVIVNLRDAHHQPHHCHVAEIHVSTDEELELRFSDASGKVSYGKGEWYNYQVFADTGF